MDPDEKMKGVKGQLETTRSPLWFKEAIIYHILIDRFAGYDASLDWKHPAFMGGSFAGIREKLGYLTDLGVNTLWLSPVNASTAYHGYHITDFYTTDIHFGTQEALKELLQAAHQRNLRVILDFVPNHCSRQHPFFIQALQDRQSRYRTWFYFSRTGNSYKSFLHFKELPKFNLENKDAGDHIVGAAKYWLSMGFDGLRLDHAVGPSHAFWKKFRNEVKSTAPEAVLIGEAWLEGIDFNLLKTIQIRQKYLRWLMQFDTRDIQREYIGELDGVLDFYFRHRITEYIAWKSDPGAYSNTLQTMLEEHYACFPENYYLPSFIDNHDMNRFLFDAGQDIEKLKLALKFQMSLPQPPVLYYGTETGLTHDTAVSMNAPFSDIQTRKPMPWESLNNPLIDYCKELIAERKRK
jgi:glycosidase